MSLTLKEMEAEQTIIISKELLSEVLGIKLKMSPCFKIEYINYNEIQYYEDRHHGEDRQYINIYELKHKCKIWALSKGYELIEYQDVIEVYNMIDMLDCHSVKQIGNISYSFYLIVEACDWILGEHK